MYVGSNHKIYKHKYFLGTIKKADSIEKNNSIIFDSYSDYDLTLYQQSEVSKLEWKTIEQCLESIRPYNLEKKTIITNVNKILQEFILS